jgi:hypothetical protein
MKTQQRDSDNRAKVAGLETQPANSNEKSTGSSGEKRAKLVAARFRETTQHKSGGATETKTSSGCRPRLRVEEHRTRAAMLRVNQKPNESAVARRFRKRAGPANPSARKMHQQLGRASTLSGKSIPEHLPRRTDPPAEKQNKPALGRIRYQKSARKMKSSDPKRKDQERNKLRFFNRNPT